MLGGVFLMRFTCLFCHHQEEEGKKMTPTPISMHEQFARSKYNAIRTNRNSIFHHGAHQEEMKRRKKGLTHKRCLPSQSTLEYQHSAIT